MAGILSEWANYIANALSGLTTKLVAAVVIILIGLILGRVLGKIVQKILHELDFDRILKKAAGIKFSLERAIARFVSYFTYFIAIIVALNQVGLTTTVLNMISAAVLIIIVISIALGIKDFIPNVLAGMHIQRKGLVREGDAIRIKGVEGTVAGVELTQVKIETKCGDIIFMPSSAFVREEVVRVSGKGRK